MAEHRKELRRLIDSLLRAVQNEQWEYAVHQVYRASELELREDDRAFLDQISMAIGDCDVQKVYSVCQAYGFAIPRKIEERRLIEFSFSNIGKRSLLWFFIAALIVWVVEILVLLFVFHSASIVEALICLILALLTVSMIAALIVVIRLDWRETLINVIFWILTGIVVPVWLWIIRTIITAHQP